MVTLPNQTDVKELFIALGRRVGDSEAGPGEVRRKVCWQLQWRQQAQALHSHGSDRRASCGVPGEWDSVKTVLARMETSLF